MRKVGKFFKDNAISREVNRALYEIVLIPTVLHGSENMTIEGSEEKTLGV